MRTSLKNIKQLEDYHFQKGPVDERLLTEARLLLEPELKDDFNTQKQVYSLVYAYGRRQLRQEIHDVHQKLFSEKQHHTFRQKILNIFKDKN